MLTMPNRTPNPGNRFALISRRVVLVGRGACFIAGFIAILSGRVGLGVALLVVMALAVIWRGLYTVVRETPAYAWRPRFDWWGARMFEK
jgi:hypothetical protein